jgi:hypothetical protein
VSLNIPIFDWGASRSKSGTAQLLVRVAENEQKIAQRVYHILCSVRKRQMR